jgi:hypothetical protein
MHKLSEKQESFVVNYISNGGMVPEACLSAGYSELYANTKGYQLLKNEAVQDLIERARGDLEVRLGITLLDKARKLKYIIDDIIPEDGSEPKRVFYKDALKAIEQLNKMCGHFMPERRVSITLDATQSKLKDARKQYDEY